MRLILDLDKDKTRGFGEWAGPKSLEAVAVSISVVLEDIEYVDIDNDMEHCEAHGAAAHADHAQAAVDAARSVGSDICNHVNSPLIMQFG